MKKIPIMFTLALFAITALLPAQTLADNSYYRKGIALAKKAQQVFDEGYYDAAKEAAAQSKVWAQLSDLYVDTMLTKTETDKAMKPAKEKISWAQGMGAANSYPELWTKAKGDMDAGQEKYQKARQDLTKAVLTEDKTDLIQSYLGSGKEGFAAAKVSADAAYAGGVAISIADADAAIAIAKDKIAWADSIDAATLYAALYTKAKSYMENSSSAYGRQEYPEAASRARAASATIDEMIAASKAEADAAIAEAQKKIAWAEGIGAPTKYAELFNKAKGELDQALEAYGKTAYPTATERARAASATVDQIAALAQAEARAAADAAIAAAKKKIAWAEGIGAPTSYADLFNKAKGELDSALDSYGKEQYLTAYEQATAAIATVDELARAAADAAIAAAKDRISWAESVEAAKNFPKELAKAKGEIAAALTAYDGKDYAEAYAKARAVLETLAKVVAIVAPPPPVWPSTYVVRLIPERRDCLWRIAEYSFIYNDPLKWPVIYEANKKTFRDPNNPNLIFPGQKLTIPSINGEERKGTFDPKAKYEVFPKVKAKKK